MGKDIREKADNRLADGKLAAPRDGGEVDAWRHAEWSYQMSKSIGYGTALIAGYAREVQGLFYYKIGDTSEDMLERMIKYEGDFDENSKVLKL